MRKNADKYQIDPARIGALGYSAGGHLVALLGTTDAGSGLEGPDADGTPTRLACVVAGGAPCDFRRVPRGMDQLSYWLGGTRAEKPEAYERASPANFVTHDDPPMLFYHGEEDRLVPLFGVRRMVEQLTAEGVPAELYVVGAAGHVPAFLDSAARERAVKFLNEHLKPPLPAGAGS
jgi:acetyl esterase/lipase